MFSASDPAVEWPHRNCHDRHPGDGRQHRSHAEVEFGQNLVDPTEQFQWLLLDAIRRFLDYLESVLENLASD
jgi:hypothetical protein